MRLSTYSCIEQRTRAGRKHATLNPSLLLSPLPCPLLCTHNPVFFQPVWPARMQERSTKFLTSHLNLIPSHPVAPLWTPRGQTGSSPHHPVSPRSTPRGSTGSSYLFHQCRHLPSSKPLPFPALVSRVEQRTRLGSVALKLTLLAATRKRRMGMRIRVRESLKLKGGNAALEGSFFRPLDGMGERRGSDGWAGGD